MLNVQEVLAARVAPARLTLVETTVIVPPPHEPLTEPVVINPDGRASVKATLVKVAAALGFVMVKLSVAFAPSGMDDGVNALLIDGGEVVRSTAFRTPEMAANPPATDVTLMSLSTAIVEYGPMPSRSWWKPAAGGVDPAKSVHAVAGGLQVSSSVTVADDPAPVAISLTRRWRLAMIADGAVMV